MRLTSSGTGSSPSSSRSTRPFDTGAKRIDQRAALDAVIYRIRTGVQWNRLPKAFDDGDPFPDDSSVQA